MSNESNPLNESSPFFLNNLTNTCLDNCQYELCPGCNLEPAIYLISQEADKLPNFKQCASFVIDFEGIDVTRLSVALALSYITIVLSVFTAADIVCYQSKNRIHRYSASLEAMMSLAILLLLIVNGGFAETINGLVTSGCYNQATMINLIAISSSLASAVSLSIVSVVVEAIEPFDKRDRDDKERKNAFRNYFNLSVLLALASIVIAALELQSLLEIVQPISQALARLNAPNGEIVTFETLFGTVTNDFPIHVVRDRAPLQFAQVLQVNLSNVPLDYIMSFYLKQTNGTNGHYQPEVCGESGFGRLASDEVSRLILNYSEHGYWASFMTVTDIFKCEWGGVVMSKADWMNYYGTFLKNWTIATLDQYEAIPYFALHCNTRYLLKLKSAVARDVSVSGETCSSSSTERLRRFDYSFTFQFVDLNHKEVSPPMETGFPASKDGYTRICSDYFDPDDSFWILRDYSSFWMCDETSICLSVRGIESNYINLYRINPETGITFVRSVNVTESVGGFIYGQYYFQNVTHTNRAAFVMHDSLSGEPVAGGVFGVGCESPDSSGVASGAELCKPAILPSYRCDRLLIKSYGMYYTVDLEKREVAFSGLNEIDFDNDDFGITKGILTVYQIVSNDREKYLLTIEFISVAVDYKVTTIPMMICLMSCFAAIL